LAFLPFAISCLCPLCLYFLPILFGGSLLSMPPLSLSLVCSKFCFSAFVLFIVFIVLFFKKLLLTSYI
jgi:hypothetical protein